MAWEICFIAFPMNIVVAARVNPTTQCYKNNFNLLMTINKYFRGVHLYSCIQYENLWNGKIFNKWRLHIDIRDFERAAAPH